MTVSPVPVSHLNFPHRLLHSLVDILTNYLLVLLLVVIHSLERISHSAQESRG